MPSFPLAFGMPGPAEWFFIAAAALLIFGKRLPEVGRSLGQGIVEFKKGLKGIESEVTGGANNAGTNYSSSTYQQAPQQQLPVQPASGQASAFKFDPYTGKPIEPSSAQQNPPQQ